MTLYVIGYFVLGTIAEICSLRILSGYIEIINTLSYLMFTFLTGVFIGRSWGDECFEKLQWHLRSRTLPADETVNGALMALVAMMFITPGVITDIFALLILIPVIRPLFKKAIVSMVKSRIAQGQPYFFFKD